MPHQNLLERLRIESNPRLQKEILQNIQSKLNQGLRFGDAKTDFCLNNATSYQDFLNLSNRMVHLIYATAKKSIAGEKAIYLEGNKPV